MKGTPIGWRPTGWKKMPLDPRDYPAAGMLGVHAIFPFGKEARRYQIAKQYQLNQLLTPQCVAFATVHNLNATPRAWHLSADDAGRFYRYIKKEIDKNNDDGSTTRSGGEAGRKLQYYKAYGFLPSVTLIKYWIMLRSPVVVGTPITVGFMNPENGIITVGDEFGFDLGHEYLLIGYDPAKDDFIILNSWGPEWGMGGFARIASKEFAKLFRRGGDALVALENKPTPAQMALGKIVSSLHSRKSAWRSSRYDTQWG